MKVKVMLRGLCCANCAAKIEEKVAGLKGVESVAVSFVTEKMMLEIREENWENIRLQMEKIIQKIEPDVTVEYL